jgi:hypothetical protein
MAATKGQWATRLEGKMTCHFPTRNDGSPGNGIAVADVAFDTCLDGVDLSHFYAAWSIVLRLYSGSERTSFVAVRGDLSLNSSLGTHIVPLELDLHTQLPVSKVLSSIASQQMARSTPAGKGWMETNGERELPCNTMVVSDVEISHENFELLQQTVR